ncbi:hypothetical protein A4H97_31205 [Niastella yeongjuensis]|uniref:DUF5977 domain-containing protein n=1 Tax=Niastella yeongjuensis TaxID=354355 RepID=A0A1V9EJK4_9BACT|nr:DUF5977 domain-containing protein [Niastella yeongjuensis]OQP46232.1 hypothetical protein A4H97_31205 [Niastella yeongjuensis]SEP46019.1 YD repeat-containing protein [Niastella yeongjuensis]
MLHSIKRCPLIIYILFLLFINNANGQPAYNLPAVIQPSPQSQAFTRYGDYPMTDYTGLTDITIPLHTITGKKLSLPVTLGFHASGRMANEVNETLGIRWTVNCGGLVTRTVKGAPDEWYNLAPYAIDPNRGEPSYEELYSACPDGKISGIPMPFYDSEFDVFNYSLPNGKHGHFILKNVNGIKVPMLIPMESLKIELSNPGSNGYYECVDITDVDGTKYRFGKIDASTGNALESTPSTDTELGKLGLVTTAWYLTKIISGDETDEISFTYGSRYINADYVTQTATVWDRGRDDDSWFWEDDTEDDYRKYLKGLVGDSYFEQTDVNQISGQNPTVPTLSAIQFSGGSVSFNYTVVNFYDRLLTEMIVNKESIPIKKVKFATSRHAGEPDLFYLDGLSFYGEDPSLVNEKYNFSYYEPGSTWMPARGVESLASKDWWGYFGPYMYQLPQRYVHILPIYGIRTYDRYIGFNVGRDGIEDYKKIGMLKTINYPTGGQTEFVYEGNRYDFTPYYTPIQNPATLEGPGLRIKEVISRPGNGGKDIHKIYKYGVYEDGRGHINELLRPGSRSREDMMVAEGNCMHFWTWLVPHSDPPQYGGENQTGYRTRDYFSDPYISFDLSGIQIKYDAVSEYLVEGDVPQQKTTNSYSWSDDEEVSNYIVNDHDQQLEYPRKYSQPEFAWYTPVLSNKSIYKYTNGQFNILRNEAYQYTGGSGLDDEAWDMPTYMHTNVIYSRPGSTRGSVDAMGWYNTAKAYHFGNCSIYGYGYRKYTTGKQELAQSIIEEYTPNGVIRTEKNFEYDNDWLLKSEEQINSKNELVKTTYSHPHDFPGVPVYYQMGQKNIIAPVVEATTTVNGIQTKKTVTNFYSPSTKVFVPLSIENQTGSKPQEVIATFNRYDNMGHILEQQKANNVKEVYLWGYQSRYPVAKILNSTFDAAISIVPQYLLDGATGNGDDVSFRNTLNLLRQNLPGALVETYTYKPFVGMTSSTDANGRTTYYEYDGFGRLIHLRDKDNNIVKKYCYNYTGQAESCPLSGNSAKSGTFIRSGCSAGNAGTPVTYTVPANTYFGPNADVLAQNDVNANGQAYANKNGACVIASYNVAKSQPFIKNNCVEGGFGSSVTYSVPANKYAAYSLDAANQLAQNEIDANGQNYANANGYCTWYNDEMSADFTRNDCQPGFTGETYSYIVYANTYSSTISKTAVTQLAQDEINDYGQYYANIYGSCQDLRSYLTLTNSGNHDCDVSLYNYEKDTIYSVNIPPGGEIPYAVPAGTYDVTFWPNDSGSGWHFYSVAGSYFATGQGSMTFTGVYLQLGTAGGYISID